MIFPWQLTTRLTGYLASNKLRRRERFPYVLMLEPLFRCNLACAGCGRIREFGDAVDQTLSREECVAAVEESGAPVVSITGGEPLIHPEIGGIVADINRRRRFVYLCTNGLLLERSLPKFQPGPYLSFVVHLDGQAATHDRNAGRPGVFDKALSGIRAAKAAGFQVRTNTTIYSNSDLDEVRQLFRTLASCGVDGVMVSPAFSFDAVDNDIFLTRAQAHGIFRTLAPYSRRFRYSNSPSTGISSPDLGRSSARPGATQRGTPSAGSAPATSSRTVTSRHSANSWKTRTGSATAWGTTPAAPTVCSIAASRRAPSRRPAGA